MKSSNRKSTEQIELVETYNLMLALNRCNQRGDWRRAFTHALQMSNVSVSWEMQVKIREALHLP